MLAEAALCLGRDEVVSPLQGFVCFVPMVLGKRCGNNGVPLRDVSLGSHVAVFLIDILYCQYFIIEEGKILSTITYSPSMWKMAVSLRLQMVMVLEFGW